MDSQPVISVRGEAQFEVEPEIALLSVTVMAQDKDRRRALKLLAGRDPRGGRPDQGIRRGGGEAGERPGEGPSRIQRRARDLSASQGMWPGLASP
jgi:hypothetical protein